jgi:hypothetical protein
MIRIFRLFLIGLLMLGVHLSLFSQGLPPGWEFSSTPSTFIISVPVISNPNINGFPLEPGDWIGVFYTNDDGELACGGAEVWLGDQNTGIIAFGNDSFTSEKDGFASGETITYRYYSWSVHQEYDAEVICNDNLPVACDVFVSNGLSGIDSTWANGYFIRASALPDSICNGSQTQLLVEPSGGSGNYTYEWTSDPAGFSANIVDPVVTPTVSTTYLVSVQDGDEILETSVYVQVFPQPVSFAGEDIFICENSSIVLSGQQSNGSDFFWSTAGDGTFDNASLLSPEYFPGQADISNGGVELSLTVNPVEPCQEPAVSSMELSIIGLPDIQVGQDQAVCEDEDVNVSATLLNAIQMEWTTSGDGTFDNPSQIETQYYPGTEDLLNGNVQLSATAFPFLPCTETDSDTLNIEFGYLPQVSAGENLLICEDENAPLTGTAANASSVLWESSGDGTFENPGLPETTYFLGTQDIVDGFVEVSLSVQAIEPCNGAEIDYLEITIVKNPETFAGNDVTICELNNLQLNGTAAGFDDLLWTTSGDGTFSDPETLNTLYIPGAIDLQNKTAVLTLSAEPMFPCVADASDDLLMTIESLPEVDAGEDELICEDENALLSGFVANASSVLWETSGDGTFENPGLPETTYFLGTQDIVDGFVEVSLSAQAIMPCNGAAIDYLEITIVKNPETFAGNDVAICETDNLQLNGEAGNFTDLLWITNGDGTFSNPEILNTLYTPGATDIQNKSVVLTLTAGPVFPCLTVASDDLLMTIGHLPEVDAGEDDVICENESYQLNALAGDYDEITWQTSGDGTFENPDILEAVYYPGSEDVQNKSVQLTITALPLFPCTLSAEDDLTLSLEYLPYVDAGDDVTIPEGEDLQLMGEAADFSSVDWMSSGDGTFSNNTVPDPVYTPGVLDVDNAGAILTLTANPVSPCIISEFDEMVLSIDTVTAINQIPVVGRPEIYPNPASEKLIIEFSLNSGQGQEILLFDGTGKCVLEKRLTRMEMFDGRKAEIVLPRVSGVFFLKVIDGDTTFVKKVILMNN